MSTNATENTTNDAADEQSARGDLDAPRSSYWPDETVDTICALVVISVLTVAVMFYVMNA